LFKVLASISGVLDWFAGGPGHNSCDPEAGYTTLWHCMKHDTFWVTVTVILNVLISIGYWRISYLWKQQERELEDGPEKRSMNNLKNIFLFCGVCGYLFIPIKLFWPAWRLYDFVILILVYFTWSFAITGKGLKVVYSRLKHTYQLEQDIAATRAESKRKSAFLNALSHDLRTPLNGASLNTQLASMALKSGSVQDAENALRDINNQIQTAAEMLNSFVEMGKLDWFTGKMEETQMTLKEVYEDIETTFSTTAGYKGLQLSLTFDKNHMVRAQHLKLKRVIMNLMDNALKFTDKGAIRIMSRGIGRDLEMVVEDTGRGMGVAEFRHLFDEFYQGENPERDRRKGFGLGLAIVKRLLTSMGGTIRVESELGVGSRFVVRLPNVICNNAEVNDASQETVGGGGRHHGEPSAVANVPSPRLGLQIGHDCQGSA
jgi:signal transduction histidine kinase